MILFAYLPARRAVITGFVAGWLFLPAASYSYKGFPDYTKISAITFGVMMGIALFDTDRLMKWRPRWIDLPMLIWCLCPLASSVLNDLGFYDGLANVLKHTLHWGIPYFVGRLYFSNPVAMRELAIGILMGGLIYMPLAWWEMRMSPQLHNIIYGFSPALFVHTIRGGGYRPMVFMNGGLAMGLWMAGASAVVLVLWRSGSLRRLWGWPILVFAVPLWITMVLCKSMGALLLLLVAAGLLFSAQYLQTRAIFLAAVLAIPIYLSARIMVNWSGEPLPQIASTFINEDRGRSLETRLDNESMIVDKSLEPGHALFGWGGYGRSRIRDEDGKDISIVDSTWIITMGERGVVGLTALFTLMLVPLLVMGLKVPPRLWFDPLLAPSFGLGLVLWIFIVDRLLNAQLNPVPLLIIGGLATMPWRQVIAAANNRQSAQMRQLAKKRLVGHAHPPGSHPAASHHSSSSHVDSKEVA
jgi:hypothetical protein